MTRKKRTGLDALGIGGGISSTDPDVKEMNTISRVRRSETPSNNSPTASPMEKSKPKEKAEIAKTTVYVPRAVFEQWRELAFAERKKMHNYLLEGLERVFADRGLKSIGELTGME